MNVKKEQNIELKTYCENLPKVFIQTNCPLCNSQNLFGKKSEQNQFDDLHNPETIKFAKTWIQLLECLECGFAFTKELPSDPNFFTGRYSIKFNAEKEISSNFKDHFSFNIFTKIEQYSNKKGNLLDIGSFAGILLRIAQKKGYTVCGIEVNSTMADYTKEVLKLNIIKGEFLDQNIPENQYDCITMIDVLEHLYLPAKILERCNQILKPNGIIFIKVPNYRPQLIKQKLMNIFGISKLGIFQNFGHINHFSPKSLSKSLEKNGFTVLENIVIPSELWNSNNFKKTISNFFRYIVFFQFKIIKVFFGINYALNFAIVAQKNQTISKTFQNKEKLNFQ